LPLYRLDRSFHTHPFACGPVAGRSTVGVDPAMARGEDWVVALDGLRLRHRWWWPAGQSAGVVVFVHGVAEHCGRYVQAAEAFCQCGCAVHAMDLRGHGESEGERAWVGSFGQYLDDLDRLLACVREVHPGLPVFMLGHSMGGAIVARFLIERKANVAGAILSAAALKLPARLFPLLRLLAPLASLLAPRLRLVSLGAKCLSRDAQVVADFEADPLNFHGRLPTRTGAEILHAVRVIESRMEEVRSPIIILHGTGDRVTDSDGSRALQARAGSNDKTLRLYDGLYHDLLHEPEREQVLADVLEWLCERRKRWVGSAG